MATFTASSKTHSSSSNNAVSRAQYSFSHVGMPRYLPDSSITSKSKSVMSISCRMVKVARKKDPDIHVGRSRNVQNDPGRPRDFVPTVFWKVRHLTWQSERMVSVRIQMRDEKRLECEAIEATHYLFFWRAKNRPPFEWLTQTLSSLYWAFSLTLIHSEKYSYQLAAGDCGDTLVHMFDDDDDRDTRVVMDGDGKRRG